MRWRRSWRAGAALALLIGAGVCLMGGCADLGYLAQSAGGHLQLMSAARPVQEWVDDPATPQALRQKLQLTQRLRDFAVQALALPDNDSYRRYADLGRKAAVWNVAAAPEFSLQLQTWCFPVAGCVSYRGYYREADAQAFAQQLKAQGLEVTVYPVPAYSTLGKLEWLGGDPLLNTFLRRSEVDLAQLMFHELAHQVVYVAGDTVFNESYATAVERLGLQRWLAAQHDAQAGQALWHTQQQAEERRRAFRALVARGRQQLEALYRQPVSPQEMRLAKADIMSALRAEYAYIKQQQWQGYAGYDAFFAEANNASLAMQAAYVAYVPAFERLFEQVNGDFSRFHAEVAQLAARPSAERRARLAALAGPTDWP